MQSQQQCRAHVKEHITSVQPLIYIYRIQIPQISSASNEVTFAGNDKGKLLCSAQRGGKKMRFFSTIAARYNYLHN